VSSARQRDWNRFRDVVELPADLTLYGFRHSASTAAVIAGLSLSEIQRWSGIATSM